MIHLECDNDESLMLALGKTRTMLSHHAGKGRVSKALSNSSRAADIGLIDQDPGQPPPPYLRQYEVIDEQKHLGLVLSQHPKEGKRLIEIQPDLEPWLYLLGESVGIDPTDHRLPAKPSGLHQDGKKHRKHLMAYLQACRSAGSLHLQQLSEWLSGA
jgi:hypothetical protein